MLGTNTSAVWTLC